MDTSGGLDVEASDGNGWENAWESVATDVTIGSGTPIAPAVVPTTSIQTAPPVAAAVAPSFGRGSEQLPSKDHLRSRGTSRGDSVAASNPVSPHTSNPVSPHTSNPVSPHTSGAPSLVEGDLSHKQLPDVRAGSARGDSLGPQLGSATIESPPDTGSKTRRSRNVSRVPPPDVVDNSEVYDIEIADCAMNVKRGFPDNYIQTAKYTMLTFLPYNLFEQFMRSKSNFYFLLSACVSLIPDITPVSPVTTLSPLIFVLVVAGIKDAYEDYTRHVADRAANSMEYSVFRRNGSGRAQPKSIRSSDIKVGDVVFVSKNMIFPADMVVLSCAHGERSCYIATANLDGESSLKRRVAIPATSMLCDIDSFAELQGRVLCELPSSDLYHFAGTIYTHIGHEQITHPLDTEHLLLRGSKLRKTRGVFGLVVYTGKDTKMYKNLWVGAIKVSRTQRMLNKSVFLILIINVILVLLSATFAAVYQGSTISRMAYMGSVGHEASWTVGLLSLLTYFVLFTYLIPISMFVTLELVRLAQALFIMMDHTMATEEDPDDVELRGFGKHTTGAVIVRNSGLNEELGLTEHIFADKTGTLTRNEMRLKLWSIAGFLYDDTMDPLQVTQMDSHKQIRADFLRAIVICNSVVPELIDGKIEYEGESPDESALVAGAARCGVTLTERGGDRVVITTRHQRGLSREEYEILATLSFSSERQRMSVIVRYPTGPVWLICKGADSKVLPLLRKKSPYGIATRKHVEEASQQGLRTLVVAVKKLKESTYLKWREQYNEAMAGLDNRQGNVEKAYLTLERDLTLIGATAVEDRLQNNIARTLQHLRACDLRIWVLTGDKLATAVNIGYSSSLLHKKVNLVYLELNPLDVRRVGMAQTLQDHMNTLYAKMKIDANGPIANTALIVGGEVLQCILEHDPLGEVFLNLTDFCQTAIFCRVSPLQKAEVVRLVKKLRQRVCLSIGDGANDVSMIRAADIGIGVIGKEGTQAARSADFAVREFQALRPILTVHGRWAHYRICNVIQYSFYKNLAFIWPLFLFGFHSAFSGQVVYDEIVLAAFNIAWASLPPFVMGVWDRDLPRRLLTRYPHLHAEYLRTAKSRFNEVSLSKWLLTAIVHGSITYTLCFVLSGPVFPNGRVGGMWYRATLTGTAGILVVLMRAGATMRHWNIFVHFSIWGTVVMYFVFIFTYMDSPLTYMNERVYSVASHVFSHGSAWFLLFINTMVCLLPDLIMHHINYNYYPTAWQRALQLDRGVSRRQVEPMVEPD